MLHPHLPASQSLPNRLTTVARLGIAALVGAAGCQIITGADGFEFDASVPASSSSGGAGGESAGAAGAGGSGGGFAECDAPEDCPGEEDTCAFRTCDVQTCGMGLALAGTACNEVEGGLCNGSGLCVACIEDMHCEPTEKCSKQKCVPLACANQQPDPGETDVDCGGESCAPCDNGKVCELATDCDSLFCMEQGAGGGGAGGSLCAACGQHADCAAVSGSYCEGGACAPLKTLGEACGEGAECETGHCVDGVCCDSGCGGKCRACVAFKTNVASGTCADIPSGADPDEECVLACNGNGGCQVL